MFALSPLVQFLQAENQHLGGFQFPGPISPVSVTASQKCNYSCIKPGSGDRSLLLQSLTSVTRPDRRVAAVAGTANKLPGGVKSLHTIFHCNL